MKNTNVNYETIPGTDTYYTESKSYEEVMDEIISMNEDEIRNEVYMWEVMDKGQEKVDREEMKKDLTEILKNEKEVQKYMEDLNMKK